MKNSQKLIKWCKNPFIWAFSPNFGQIGQFKYCHFNFSQSLNDYVHCKYKISHLYGLKQVENQSKLIKWCKNPFIQAFPPNFGQIGQSAYRRFNFSQSLNDYVHCKYKISQLYWLKQVENQSKLKKWCKIPLFGHFPQISDRLDSTNIVVLIFLNHLMIMFIVSVKLASYMG